MKAKRVWRAALFLLLAAAGLFMMGRVFRMGDKFAEKSMHTFYEEKAPLDALYIGASRVFFYWQAPLAWREYGITVLDVASANKPLASFKYQIEECLKTQNPKLIIIDTSSFTNSDYSSMYLHAACDYLKFSPTKLAAIRAVCREADLSLMESLEYYLPFLRFHSRWTELTADDFKYLRSDYKNAYDAPVFLSSHTAIPKGDVAATDVRAPMPREKEALLRDLLNYLKSKKLNVLFLAQGAVSQPLNTQEQNTVGDIIATYGYTFLNYGDPALYNQVGYKFPDDYVDAGHTNVKGAVKYTHHFGRYLTDTYGFGDKRGEPGYASWDRAYDAYYKLIRDYLPADYKIKYLSIDPLTASLSADTDIIYNGTVK